MIRAVMCLQGFRSWRLALFFPHTLRGPCWSRDNNRQSGLTSGLYRIVHAPETATQRALRAAERPCAPRLHAHLSDQIWVFRVPYLGMYVTRRSLYKAGNPRRRKLTKLKCKLTLSVHKTPTGNKQLLLFPLPDDFIHKDPPEII